MQTTLIFKRLWMLFFVAGLLFTGLTASESSAAEQADQLLDKTQQEQKTDQTAPGSPGEQAKDKEKRNKEVQMLSDLYVDCLAVANYARYYLSEELLSPEDGDKICGEIADKSRSVLELMKFSGAEIESFFEEAKQKAQKLLEEKFPNLQKKPAKPTPDDTVASSV